MDSRAHFLAPRACVLAASSNLGLWNNDWLPARRCRLLALAVYTGWAHRDMRSQG